MPYTLHIFSVKVRTERKLESFKFKPHEFSTKTFFLNLLTIPLYIILWNVKQIKVFNCHNLLDKLASKDRILKIFLNLGGGEAAVVITDDVGHGVAGLELLAASAVVT